MNWKNFLFISFLMAGPVQVAMATDVQIELGHIHYCVLDDDGVKCWGRIESGYFNVPVPPLRNPKTVSAGRVHTCTIDDNGVKCWGYNEDGQTNVPPLRNPKMVSAGFYHTCALDDNGVKCWGGNEYGQTNVPPLKNPRMVSTGRLHTCAIDEDGIKCWGFNEYGQSEVASELELVSRTVQFHITTLAENFSKLSRFVYRYKESFFKGLASEIASMPLDEKLPGTLCRVRAGVTEIGQ